MSETDLAHQLLPLRRLRRDLRLEGQRAPVHREPRYEKCKPGDTHVLVEVFAIADEQVDADEPRTKPIDQVVRKPGFMTQALIDGLPGTITR